MMRGNGKAALKISIALSILLTLGFIFYNSALSPEASTAQSDGAMGILALIFPSGTALNSFFSKYIRKVAHFVEYFLLGTELSLYALLCTDKKIKNMPYALGFLSASAALDETIQIFSKRGNSVLDVLLDISGGASAMLVICIVYIILLKTKIGRKK
jgi:VanZ family protein